MSDKKDSTTSNRRTFLKTSGVLASGFVTTGTAFAQQQKKEMRDVRKQSLELRRKNDWDIHQWRRYLANRNVDFDYKNAVRKVPVQNGDDGPSTEELEHGECYLYITVVNDLYKYVDFEWETWNGVWKDPEEPMDHAAIAWDSDDFDKGSSIVYGDYVSKITNMNSETSTGVAVQYDDKAHDAEEEYMGSWFHQQVNPEAGTSKYGRQIFVDYSHTWKEIGLDSISFSSAGAVTFTYDDPTYRWVREADGYESNMDDGETYKDSP